MEHRDRLNADRNTGYILVKLPQMRLSRFRDALRRDHQTANLTKDGKTICAILLVSRLGIFHIVLGAIEPDRASAFIDTRLILNGLGYELLGRHDPRGVQSL